MEKSNGIEIGKIIEDIRSFVSDNLRQTGNAASTPKVSKVNLKRAVLSSLQSGSKTGREVIHAITAASAGIWVPNDSEIFPALADYVDAGLVSTKINDELKVFKLTDAGKKWLQENPMEEENFTSNSNTKLKSKSEFAKAGLQFGQTVATVASSSSNRTFEQATEIIHEATKKLHLLLAKDN